MIKLASAKAFCKDDYTKIENYEQAKNDTTQTWELHHRLELTLDGEASRRRQRNGNNV